MKLILLGAPGAGKGTQAERICEEYSLPHISTGEILRKELREQSDVGKRAQEFIDQGELVPDDIMLEIVDNRLKQQDCQKGFLLDGFPRTMPQAEALSQRIAIDCTINIDVPFDKLTDRITGRRVCPGCGATYHVSQLSAPDAPCRCGKQLYQRDDDKVETVRNRLNVYAAQTQPLIAYYEQKALLHTIDGNRSVGDVFADVCAVLEQI